MGLQEDHDLPDDLLLGPGPGDPILALRTDALEPVSRSGSCSMTSKTAAPKAWTSFLAK